MSVGMTLLWLTLGLIGMIGSAMFSGLETGIYTLNRVRLHVYAHAPFRSAVILSDLTSRPNRLLGTLLIGNNMVNYLASYSIAVLLEAAGYSDWGMVAINAALLTPLLFVFGEVLPKDLFQTYSDRLTYVFARPLAVVQRVLWWTGLLPLVDGVSRALAHILKTPELTVHTLHPRRVVTQLFKEGLGRGLLTPYQSAMIDRVLEPEAHRVEEVMVPWEEVQTVRAHQPPEAVWALVDRVPYTRMPVMEDGRVVGVLDVFDVLLREPGACPPLGELAREAPRFRPQASLREALVTMQQSRARMGLVMDAEGRPMGVVTIKDLVEPIVGELESW